MVRYYVDYTYNWLYWLHKYIYLHNVKYVLFLTWDISSYLNDRVANWFEILSKWHSLLRLEYIQSVHILSEQVSYEIISRWKPSSISRWAEVSTFLSIFEIKFPCFFFTFSILKTFRGWHTMKCLINTPKHSTISVLFDRCIRYYHTNWLVYEWNVKLHCID